MKEKVKNKIEDNRTSEIIEKKENDVEKTAEKVVDQIEKEQIEILESTDKKIESISDSINLEKNKAESISQSGGFNEKIKNAKEKIATIADNAKEKINLFQLKLQGIKNPEKVLDLAHYLEKNAISVDHRFKEIDNKKENKIKKVSQKFESKGYDVYTYTGHFDKENRKVHATKEMPYSFNAGGSKWFNKDLDNLINSPNDPKKVFDSLRDLGYEIKIFDKFQFDDKNTGMEDLFQNPNILPLLNKLKTFGGKNIEHSYIKKNDGLNSFMSMLSELATADANENLLTPEVEKNIEKISNFLGRPIDSDYLELWAKISQSDALVDVIDLLEDERKEKKQEWGLVHDLEIIKKFKIDNEVATLLKDGFTMRSFGKLSGWGEDGSRDSANNIKTSTEVFKNNPGLSMLVKKASDFLNIDDPLNKENMNKFEDLYLKIPEAGQAFANLADIDLETRYGSSGFLDKPEEFEKYRKVLETVADPSFKEIATSCEKAGYKFSMYDFFNESPQNSNLPYIFNNESFRSAIVTKQGQDLAKYLGVFEVSLKNWNSYAFGALAQIPDAITSLQKIEESYGYKFNPSDDYGHHESSNLVGILKDKEFCDDLLDPSNVKAVSQINSEMGIKLNLPTIESLIKEISSKDQDFKTALEDEDVMTFLKNVTKEDYFRVEIFTLLAKCEKDLQPVVEKMVKEFDYEPGSSYIHEYDKKTGDVKYEKVLKDYDKFVELRDNPLILEMQSRLEMIGLKKNPIYNIEILKNVIDNNLFEVFEKCQSHPKIQEFMWKNFESANTLSKLAPDRMTIYLEIFQKIDDSPSQEIQRLKDSLLSQLSESKNPTEDYEKIESIFIKNNIPTFGKVYGVFETLYNPENLKGKIRDNSSPVLQQASMRKRYYTIYQDLLKIHIKSGNRSMKEYVEVLQSGGKIIEQYENEGLDSLNSRQKDELSYFVRKLETLQLKSALDTADDAFSMAETDDLLSRINHVKEGLKVAEGQTVLERISDMYLRPVGLKSLGEILEVMRKSKTAADERGRKIVNEAKQKSNDKDIFLELEEGDFLKGVDAGYINIILQNGSVAKEFLGASSESDATPLDTDISLVKMEDAEGGFENSINKSIAASFGGIIFALKDRGQYQLTTKDQKIKNENDKMELFQTGVVNDRHYGIRTGFPTTEIDFIIAREELISQKKDLENLYFEIAQNGFYIPITNTLGKVIFTPEQYEEYRKPFTGLEKFDAPRLEYEPTKVSEHSSERVKEMTTDIKEDVQKIDQATKDIREEIEQALGKLNVHLRNEFDTSILGAELLDIGSTGRHTNTPGDFDFDFNLKLDAKDFPRSVELAESIKKMLTFTKDNSHTEVSGYHQLRVKGVTAIGEHHLEKPIDIDIGFASKSDLNVYGSHDAIRDKLNNIKKHNGQESYEETIANIVLTKKILKEGHAYKKLEDGGFGGVGVENWILANGGNMEEAFKNFRDNAYENGKRLPYEQFKGKYKILDPGINIKFNNHDNFIEVLKPSGYEAILNTIENYFKQK